MAEPVKVELTHLVVGGLLVLAVGAVLGIGWHWLMTARKGAATVEQRPIYWNLIFFATVGAAFSVAAMLLVDHDDRSGIALLFLGLIGGYAASIKELDLAKVELDKLRLESSINQNGKKPEDSKDD
ncbi:MAG: hypothetical protein OXI22_13195 [Defluviicoccus sp.]|nr:hypothetical protein [Defluviicoccus sp.]